MTADGYTARGYESVRDAFAAAQSADEGGAQLCIYRHGRKVVDVWAGRDTLDDRAYGEGTLTVIMSATKGATAAVVHTLAQRGLIDYEAPVTDYWPEFAACGKASARVWHLLTHAVGLPGFDPESGVSVQDLLYPDRHVPLLEAMVPVWEPGASCQYHPITYGSLIGEVVRRVTGKSLGRVFDEEIRAPLGLDFWIGLPAEQEGRIARHFKPRPDPSPEQIAALVGGSGVDLTTRLARVVLQGINQTLVLINDHLGTREGRAAEAPAANGVADAASLAKLYAAMIGEVDGVRLLSPETLENARGLRTAGMEAPGDFAKGALGLSTQYGLGYELSPYLGAGSFGHAGAGGRLAFAHPESGTAAAFVANTMRPGPDPRWTWVGELRKAVAA
jgi:CubicO group peptidase (beta-lactamase class C family)